MRIEMWPSTSGQAPDCYVTIHLTAETVDFLMSQSGGVMSSWASSTQVTETNQAARFRVRSPLMLLTVCQGRLRTYPDLRKMVDLLKGAADLNWEIRVPVDGWEDNGPDTVDLLDEIKEEVPV